MIIKNARIIDPSCGRDETGDIYIRDKKIVNREDYGVFADDEIIDASGLIAGPGLVDVHVHFRDPGQTYKEDIHTGAACSARGGFTSVVMMANTVPPVDDPALVRDIINRCKNENIHIYTCATLTKGMKGLQMCDYESLAAAGAVGFTDDGKPVMDEALLSEAFCRIQKLGLPVSLHEEDPKYITQPGIDHGDVASSLGLTGADRLAEISMIKRDLMIAAKSGVKLNIQHISTAEGIDAVRRAKITYPNIHAEAAPHHFTLTSEAVRQFGTLAKMNPPLRTASDREAIREGLCDGTIDMIATDHAPHAENEKALEFTAAPSGITGLETAFLLAYSVLYKNDMADMNRLFELMSLNPARLYGLDAGTLAPGAPADIMIFSENDRTVYDSSCSKSKNSPFLGRTFDGRIVYTIADGKVAYFS